MLGEPLLGQAGASRFFGLYRGICVDNADPELLFRITVQVPQLMGEEITTWAWPCRPPDAVQPVAHTAVEVAALLNVMATATATADTSVLDGHTHVITADVLADVTPAPALLVPPENVLPHVKPDVLPPDPGLVLHPGLPAVGQGVWVMFEAGDPDSPVWMGTF